MLFFLTVYSSKNQRKQFHKLHKTICSNTTVSTLIINQHIQMISEGSRDTEDALHHINKLYLKVY